MSANIPETKLVSELLKPTGFNCPPKLQGMTMAQIEAAIPDDDAEDDEDEEDND